MMYYIKAGSTRGHATRVKRSDHWTIRINGQDRAYLYGSVSEMKKCAKDIINKDDKNPAKVTFRKY